MDSVWSFKTFNLGRELETAGEFIYESAKKMIGIKNFYNKYEVNTILYLGSVGIERLQKILLCLYCMNTESDFDTPPQCLLNHNYLDLQKEITKYADCKLSKQDMSLLSIFQDYYHDYRYGNYRLFDGKDVRELLARFFKKTNKPLDIEIGYTEFQKDSFAKNYINHLGAIAKKLFKLIRDKAYELNIYTCELDSESNSFRVFYLKEGKTFFEQMINERISVKELMIYIRHYNGHDGVFNILDEMQPLEYGSGMIQDYIHQLCRGNTSDDLCSSTDELYCRIATEKDKIARKNEVDLIGNNDLWFDYELDD